MNDSSKWDVTPLPITSITADPQVQPRVELDAFVIDEYARAMAGGAHFPPVVVFSDGATYWLSDGFHRVSAAKEAGLDSMEAEVHEGGLRDAILHAVGANVTHGKRRTNRDKRRGVEMLLRDEEWSQWSNGEVSRRAAVSEGLVRRVRQKLSSHNTKMENGSAGDRLVRRGASEYRMRTGLIGQGMKLTALVRDVLRDTTIADDDRQLHRLSREEPEVQLQVAEKVARGEAPSVFAALRDVRYEEKREASLKDVEGRHSVVLADPPWHFDSGEGLQGAVAEEYPTMALEDIEALPVAEKTTEDAVIFLWSTNPHLPGALGVISAWGFTYKTNLVWVKNTFGLGHYVRGQHELLLIGTRGSMLPKTAVSSVLHADARGHSVKPDEVYDVIETMYPGMRYLELFARRPPTRPNWTAWGNEPALKN